MINQPQPGSLERWQYRRQHSFLLTGAFEGVSPSQLTGWLRLPLFLLLTLAVAACDRDEVRRPNIVLISLDTLRARSMNTYGYERDTSPFFDELAQKGVLFDNAISTSATTAPAHMSLFTGLYPRRHGLRSGMTKSKVPESTPRLAKILQDAGYRTKAITENGYIIRRLGFDYGFEDYSEYTGHNKRSAPGLVEESFREAREWIEKGQSEPYFLFLHTYEVHAPYRAPAMFRHLFFENGKPTHLDRDLYDGEIYYLDNDLRNLFEVFESRSSEHGTVFVILSDHGEEFGEHGASQHGTQVYEESIHIPLLFYGSGIPQPRRIARQVSLIDVLPTLLDLVDLEVPPSLDGVSLKNTILEGAAPPVRPLFAEAASQIRWIGLIGEHNLVKVQPVRVALRFDDHKFIVHRPEEGTADDTLKFNIEADPWEQSPIDIEESEREVIEALVDRHVGVTDAATGVQDPEAFKRDADPALIERLRSLGYIE